MWYCALGWYLSITGHPAKTTVDSSLWVSSNIIFHFRCCNMSWTDTYIMIGPDWKLVPCNMWKPIAWPPHLTNERLRPKKKSLRSLLKCLVHARKVGGGGYMCIQNVHIYLLLIYCVQRHLQQYFSYIMATSFRVGRSQSTRREPLTMGKHLVW